MLSSLYYQNKEEYERMFRNRFDSESTFHFPIIGLEAAPFVIMTRQLTRLLEQIYQQDKRLEALFLRLPGIVRENYLNSCLEDEIILTNGIEGVHSTRKEVNEAIAMASSDKMVRFQGLAKRYLSLLADELPPLKNSAHIRAIYDQLIAQEMEADNLPDGKMFRKSAVSVRSATDKEKHRGVYPEEKIIAMMDSALQMLDIDDIPYLLRVAVFHYLFGYIHPFYDGNGRMSRFISSCLLRGVLHPLIGLRLSYFIKNDISAYYKAFDICNDPKNCGDMTPFVRMFLQVLQVGIDEQYDKLLELEKKLEYYNGLVRRFRVTGLASNILYVLIQYMVFREEGLTVQELQAVLKQASLQHGYGTIKKAIAEAQEAGAPICVERCGHAFVYVVDLEALEA